MTTMRSLEYETVAHSTEDDDEHHFPESERSRRHRSGLYFSEWQLYILVACLTVWLVAAVRTGGRASTSSSSSFDDQPSTPQSPTMGENNNKAPTIEDVARPKSSMAARPGSGHVTPSTPPSLSSQQQPPPSDGVSSCEDYYDCQTDRMGHEQPLYPGQALCNDRYRFGLTREGVFQWQECLGGSNNTTQVFYDGATLNFTYSGIATSSSNQQRLHFVMRTDATFQIVLLSGTGGDESVVWEDTMTCGIVHVYKHCLSRPLLDCPYLHLHKSGDIVLNWIDDNGHWNDRNSKKCYKQLLET
jgi:hypothetical protein